MRRVSAAAAAVALAATALVGAAGPATARTAPANEVEVVGSVDFSRADPETATIRVRYTCEPGASLWLSVKQTADRTADPALAAPGSSQISAAWSDSHRNAIVCDGEQHNVRLSVDQLEPYFTAEGPVGQKSDVYDPLAKGFGYVQVCLIDPTAETEQESLLASENSFRRVR